MSDADVAHRYLDYLCALCGHGGHYHHSSDKLPRDCNYPTTKASHLPNTIGHVVAPCGCRIFDPVDEVIKMRTDDRSNLPQTHIGVRYDLMLPDWLREIAEVLGEGSIKYGDNSWMRIPLDEHLNHVMAHIQQYREGDRSERHLINIVCRMMFSYWTDKHPGEQQAALQQYLLDQQMLKAELNPDLEPNCPSCNERLWCTSFGDVVCLTKECPRHTTLPSNATVRRAELQDMRAILIHDEEQERRIADAAYGVDPTSSHDDANTANTTDDGHGPTQA